MCEGSPPTIRSGATVLVVTSERCTKLVGTKPPLSNTKIVRVSETLRSPTCSTDGATRCGVLAKLDTPPPLIGTEPPLIIALGVIPSPWNYEFTTSVF